MSTLTTLPRRVRATSEDKARFDALVRSVVPAQRTDDAGAANSVPAGSDLETVFDLDYGQNAIESLTATRAPQALRRERAAAAVELRTESAPTGRLRLTRRGRALVTLVFAGAALALMTVMGGWAAASLSGGRPPAGP